MDIYKQIKEETNIEYLTQLESYVDDDISRIGQEGEKILSMKAKMYNTTPEKLLVKQKEDLNKLKEFIQNRIKTLNNKL